MRTVHTLVPMAVLLPVVLVLSACSSSGSSGPSVAQGESRYSGALVAEPMAKPDAVLVDTDGKPYDIRKETKGDLTLLYVGYTHCPDICPAHMANIAAALKRLPLDEAKQVKVLFITSDPDRDTPAVLRAWLDKFDPRFIGLTSSQDNLDAVQRALGLQIAVKQDTGDGGYTVAHAADVLLFTNDNLAHIEYEPGSGPDDFAHDIPLLLKGWKNP